MFTVGILASGFLLAGIGMALSYEDNTKPRKNYTVYQTGENSYLLVSKKKRRKQKGRQKGRTRLH